MDSKIELGSVEVEAASRTARRVPGESDTMTVFRGNGLAKAKWNAFVARARVERQFDFPPTDLQFRIDRDAVSGNGCDLAFDFDIQC